MEYRDCSPATYKESADIYIQDSLGGEARELKKRKGTEQEIVRLRISDASNVDKQAIRSLKGRLTG